MFNDMNMMLAGEKNVSSTLGPQPSLQRLSYSRGARRSKVLHQRPVRLPPDGGVGRKKSEAVQPEVVVGLNLGTHFVYSHKSMPSHISSNFSEHEAYRSDEISVGIYYNGRANGDLCFRSWGYDAINEYEQDLAAVRKMRDKVAANVSVRSSTGRPVLGYYVMPFKQKYLRSDTWPQFASGRPPGLTLNRVISDYFRAIGELILRNLQDRFGSQLLMEHVQWCVAVPSSIWSPNSRQQIKSCMVNAGLVVGGSNGRNASAHPGNVIMVLETDAASYDCSKEWCLQRADKVLLANIGDETTDVVVQEFVGREAASGFTAFRAVMRSTGDLRGEMDKQIIEFLCQKIGPLREYLLEFPYDRSVLLRHCEHKIDDYISHHSLMSLPLPRKLAMAWANHDQKFQLLPRESYREIELLFTDFINILHPIAQASVDLIAAQLSQTSGITLMAVVNTLRFSPDIEEMIRHRFDGKVGKIVFVPFKEMAVCMGAVKIVQNCFPGPATQAFDLVVEVIDNVLLQTRQKDNQDAAKDNWVTINQGQCNHSANKLVEVKDWLLQEKNLAFISWDMRYIALQHLLRVVKRAHLLVQECYKGHWVKAAVLQAGNDEAFVAILHDLKWCSTHLRNVTIPAH